MLLGIITCFTVGDISKEVICKNSTPAMIELLLNRVRFLLLVVAATSMTYDETPNLSIASRACFHLGAA